MNKYIKIIALPLLFLLQIIPLQALTLDNIRIENTEDFKKVKNEILKLHKDNDELIDIDLSFSYINKDIQDIPNDFFEALNKVNIPSLEINNTNLTSIPKSINNLRELKDLDLSSNKISNLPESITSLRKLRSLNLKNNKLSTLPKSFENLTNLISLDISDNEFTSIPDSLKNLLTKTKKLKILGIEQITCPICYESLYYKQDEHDHLIPRLGSELTQLTCNKKHIFHKECISTWLSKNKTCPICRTNVIGEFKFVFHIKEQEDLETIKKSILEIKQILPIVLELSFKGSTIKIIPESFFEDLDKLKITQITIINSQLEALPKSLGKLPYLQIIYLQNNEHLISFPTELENLKNLTNLIMIDCGEFKTLPELFFQFQNLKYLTLKDNLIEYFPDLFSKLQKLETLVLDGNMTLDLPESLGSLKNLKVLKINNNHDLSGLPSSFANLSNLEDLELMNNLISELPEKFEKLPKLKRLNLYFNDLKDLPNNFGDLKKLIWLNLSQNQLKILPDSFTNLNNLEYLNLNRNQDPENGNPGLLELPKNFGDLKKLKILDVSINSIKTLPESFQELDDLKQIDISYNKLKSMPNGLEKLKEKRRENLTIIGMDKQITEVSFLQKIKTFLNKHRT